MKAWLLPYLDEASSRSRKQQIAIILSRREQAFHARKAAEAKEQFQTYKGKSPKEVDFNKTNTLCGWVNSSGKIRWYREHVDGMLDLLPKHQVRKMQNENPEKEAEPYYKKMFEGGYARITVGRNASQQKTMFIDRIVSLNGKNTSSPVSSGQRSAVSKLAKELGWVAVEDRFDKTPVIYEPPE